MARKKKKSVRKNAYNRSGRRARPFFKEVVIGKMLPAIFFCAVIISIAWLFTSGEYERIKERAHEFFIAQTAEVGFVVENLTVKGRNNLSPESVTAILNIKRGDPLFIFNPDTMRKQLEGLSWVKHVRIERRLPNTVYIEITECEPFALWQKDKKLAIIDDEGKVLTRDNLGKYGELLHVIGEKANTNAAQLIQYLEVVPDIKKRIASATWIGNRRWDLTLENKIKVRLPEKDVPVALRTLAKMQNKDKLLDRAIVLVDLRIEDKIIVRPEKGANTQIERPNFDENKKSGKHKAI